VFLLFKERLWKRKIEFMMMLTIPIVIYGVARYLYIIYEKGEGESPERVLLSDKPLLFTVVLWGVLAMAITYLIPGGAE